MKLFSSASRIFVSSRNALAASVVCGVLLAASGGSVWADPPARAGRIAEVSGTAWLFDLETKAWARVLRNQTVGQGDQVRTDTRSRVTFRVGSSTVWLDGESDMEVLQMDDAATVVRLIAGNLALRLRTVQAAQETRVQTREGVLSPEVGGLFRMDQLDRGSRMAVLQGRAYFDPDDGTPVQRAWLREGEQAEFWRAESPRAERQPIRHDRFSAWFLAQDQAEGALALGDGATYVSPEMTGAEDLNQNGHWEIAAEYGNVWIPIRVTAGWEPYRDGRWVWTRHWGWSWVDNAPWGFAPFHYGRWILHRGLWAWAPGRFEPRPAYSPGVVAWVGGPQVSLGLAIGGIRRPPQTGWLPLAPHQNYVPVYPHSPHYGDRFRWGLAAINASRNDRHDRFDKNKPDPQPDDSGPQSYRPHRWSRESPENNRDRDHDMHNREPGQSIQRPTPVITPSNTFVPAQALPQTPAQPQVLPTQNWHQVPNFNREAPAQHQRPLAPQMQQVQQVPQHGPQHARPLGDDTPNGKRKRRENQDRDLR